VKILAENRKAYFNYFIKDKFEAGIVLEGWEVKSARAGQISLDESFVHCKRRGTKSGELVLENSYFAHYKDGDINAQETKRNRRLLLNKSEIEKITKDVMLKGSSCVVTKIYINKAGLIKAEIAVAVGKHSYDKRQVLKERDIAREINMLYNK
jgi:SsrA-binding protein